MNGATDITRITDVGLSSVEERTVVIELLIRVRTVQVRVDEHPVGVFIRVLLADWLAEPGDLPLRDTSTGAGVAWASDDRGRIVLILPGVRAQPIAAHVEESLRKYL
jgi:hypothetical protein